MKGSVYLKIIHCADLHLDSRMETNLTSEKAAQRNSEICTTFSRMVDFAVEKKVSLILIAGDMFDTKRTRKKTADYVIDKIRLTPQIDFLYLRGNHDESQQAFDEDEIPSNLKLFTENWTSYRYNSVVVTGIELNSDNYISLYTSLMLKEDDLNIVMMHGQESSQPGEEIICTSLLKDKFIDYLALGHIHSYKVEQLDYRGKYCYSGCLEGRGFDECGEKGFVLIDINGNRVSSDFIPFASRILCEVPVDITGLVKISEIRQAMLDAVSSINSECLVKCVITGKYNLDTQKDLRYLLPELQSRFFFAKIKDESTLAIRADDYQNDVSLKGEFIRMVLASNHTEEEKSQIISCGIQALTGEEIVI